MLSLPGLGTRRHCLFQKRSTVPSCIQKYRECPPKAQHFVRCGLKMALETAFQIVVSRDFRTSRWIKTNEKSSVNEYPQQIIHASEFNGSTETGQSSILAVS